MLIHSTPTRLTVTDELTLLNPTQENLDYVILRYHAYRPSMIVIDDDGTQLGLLTNEKVRELLAEPVSSGDEYAKKMLEGIDNHTQYVQWVSFPKDRPFAGYQIRVIRFTYQIPETKPKKERGSLLSWLKSKLKMFDVPDFKIEEELPISDPPTRFVVTPPDGFITKETYVKLRAKKKGQDWREIQNHQEHYHVTAEPNVIDVNVPHIPDSTLSFQLYYGIRLEKNEEKLYRTFISALLGFTIVYGLIITILPPITINLRLPKFEIPLNMTNTFPYTAPITSRVISQESLITTAIIFTALAFVGLTSNKITHPIKYWALVAIVTTLLAVLLSPSQILS